MARIIDGKSIAAEIRTVLKKRVADLETAPRLAVILVGRDPASVLYVSLKEKAAREVGIEFERYDLPESVSQAEIIAKISGLNARPDVSGIIVQLPLPAGLATDAVINAIDPDKDADGFHPQNIERLKNGGSVLPGLTEGILILIASAEKELVGKRALVISNSEIFSEPLRIALERQGISVKKIFDLSDREYLANLALESEIIVSAVGKPGVVTGEMVRDGAVLIDVGTTRLADNKVVGDVLAADFSDRDVALTPVPGGVGPMTVAMLLKRVIESAEKNNAGVVRPLKRE